jgi:hypothetical protein
MMYGGGWYGSAATGQADKEVRPSVWCMTEPIMFLLHVIAAIVGLAIAAGATLYAAAPRIERSMAFHPARSDPGAPWTLPVQTIDVSFTAAELIAFLPAPSR